MFRQVQGSQIGMPNKYEREIEEILRNLERTEPKAGFGRKFRGRTPRQARARRSLPTLRLSFSEWCLVAAFVLALCAGGWEYANSEITTAVIVGLGDSTIARILVHLGGNIITGILALIGFAFVMIVAITPFAARPHYSPSSRRYDNITPFRRSNPFARLVTRWNLLMLKLRYRKRRNLEE
jgi:hypothetical protein